MDIVDNRALKLKVKNPERITALISKSKQLAEISPGVHEVLVHWGLHEAQLLNNLKLKNVPSPIRARYNWPGTYKPFDHQRVVSEFLTLNRRAFCFSEQGTMKTSSVLWAVDYLMKQQEIKRVLVVCPVSIMKPVWVNDAFKTIMHRKIAIAHGTRDQRLAVINGPYEIVVINYDGVPMMLEQLRGKFDLLVLDEANAVKNVQTTRWKSISSLVTPKTWLWLMTGTPAAQSPVDAYGLARLVCPQRVPQFFSAWQSKVMRKISLFRFVPVYNASDIVHQTLQPSIRFTKEECLDLPEMTYQFREVPLTAQQLKYYKAFKKEMMINAAGEQITAVHAAAQLNKLLQLSCGCIYADNGEVIRFDADNRILELINIIEEASKKVIVFVPFRHAINAVVDRLTETGYTVHKISGEVPASQRAVTIDLFQTAADPRVLVIQPQSAAHGITLTAADTVVWFGPTHSVETYLQGNARVHRNGQTSCTTVIKLCGSEVERKVYDAVEKKEMGQATLMALYEDLTRA